MNFFNWGKSPEKIYQEGIINEFSRMFRSEGVEDPDGQAREFVETALKKVVSSGLDKEPNGYRDFLLSREHVNEQIAAQFKACRLEGVTDDDIRWWWNMPPLERVLIQQTDEAHAESAIAGCLMQGLDPDDAIRKVAKSLARFGELVSSHNPDRPLPIELKLRIQNWKDRNFRQPLRFQNMNDASSSFNALVRSEIANGML